MCSEMDEFLPAYTDTDDGSDDCVDEELRRDLYSLRAVLEGHVGPSDAGKAPPHMERGEGWGGEGEGWGGEGEGGGGVALAAPLALCSVPCPSLVPSPITSLARIAYSIRAAKFGLAVWLGSTRNCAQPMPCWRVTWDPPMAVRPPLNGDLTH